MSHSTYHWTTQFHVSQGRGSAMLLQVCKPLQICKQTTTERYKVTEELYFFAGETGEDDPVYSLKEILTEAEYRRALRERDLIESAEGDTEL